MLAEAYFPPPLSQGGWRYLVQPEDVRQVGGMDPLKLDNLLHNQELLLGGDSWGIAIIRHGYLVREHYTFNVLTPTRFRRLVVHQVFHRRHLGLFTGRQPPGPAARRGAGRPGHSGLPLYSRRLPAV